MELHIVRRAKNWKPRFWKNAKHFSARLESDAGDARDGERYRAKRKQVMDDYAMNPGGFWAKAIGNDTDKFDRAWDLEFKDIYAALRASAGGEKG